MLSDPPSHLRWDWWRPWKVEAQTSTHHTWYKPLRLNISLHKHNNTCTHTRAHTPSCGFSFVLHNTPIKVLHQFQLLLYSSPRCQSLLARKHTNTHTCKNTPDHLCALNLSSRTTGPSPSRSMSWQARVPEPRGAVSRVRRSRQGWEEKEGMWENWSLVGFLITPAVVKVCVCVYLWMCVCERETWVLKEWETQGWQGNRKPDSGDKNLGQGLLSEVWKCLSVRTPLWRRENTHNMRYTPNQKLNTSLSYFTVDKKANQNKTNCQSTASERNKKQCMHVWTHTKQLDLKATACNTVLTATPTSSSWPHAAD